MVSCVVLGTDLKKTKIKIKNRSSFRVSRLRGFVPLHHLFRGGMSRVEATLTHPSHSLGVNGRAGKGKAWLNLRDWIILGLSELTGHLVMSSGHS